MTNDTVPQFLLHLQGDSDGAMLIASEASYAQALADVESAGYSVTGIYEDAVGLLEKGESVALKVDRELSSELYDLIRQYSHRRGIIQVLPKARSVSPLLQLDTEHTKLLLVLSAEHERRNLERYPELFELVGKVERI
jgi:hypothetical protein